MHPSNSAAQQEIEEIVLKKLNGEAELKLKPKTIDLTDNTKVEVDGFDEEEKTICEIFTHVGALKSGQSRKVASDFLKMLLVEKTLGYELEKYFCFTDEKASAHVTGNSWLALAAKNFKINIKVIELPEERKKSIESVQIKQNPHNQ